MINMDLIKQESALGEWQASRAYEQGLPAVSRNRNGQYYTPRTLCDLMLALALKPHVQRLLEPGCGAGNFLVRACERLHRLNDLPWQACLQALHGVELDEDAATIAIQQLKDKVPDGEPNVLIADFMSPAVDGLGDFDAIIGNPPYVRQENLAQRAGPNKQVGLEYLIAKYTDYLKQYPEQSTLFSQTADLYVWFFLQATTLLRPGGTLAFVTSNSWLNTSFGQAFRTFLNHHFHVKVLVESACERWFPDAAINPVIVVLEKKFPECGHIPKDEVEQEPVRLIRFLTPLEHWLPSTQQPDYWHQLDRKIKAMPSDAGLDIKWVEAHQLFGQAHVASWAFLLRAPQEVTALRAIPELWVRLDSLGQVRYPLKTGINRFFYLSRAQAEAWGIEPEFLFPVLRSSRSVKGYRVNTATCEEYLFSCSMPMEALERLGKIGALRYIQWGQGQTSMPRQKRVKPVPWPQVPSVKNNRPWYFVRPLPPAHILCNRFVDQRFFFALCEGEVMEDQTFYGLTLREPEETPPPLVAALLNSTLSCVMVEFSGRTNLGEGVLQFARCDMASLPVLNPALYSPQEKQAICEAFERMAQRPIMPLLDECAAADRIALDLAVLTPLWKYLGTQFGKNQSCSQAAIADFRERLAGYLLTRVQERARLARSVKKGAI